jgi:hypothetical protein
MLAQLDCTERRLQSVDQSEDRVSGGAQTKVLKACGLQFVNLVGRGRK